MTLMGRGVGVMAVDGITDRQRARSFEAILVQLDDVIFEDRIFMLKTDTQGNKNCIYVNNTIYEETIILYIWERKSYSSAQGLIPHFSSYGPKYRFRAV